MGAHVRFTHGNATREVWIVPLCNGCNQIPTRDEFYVLDSVIPVSANRQRMRCYMRYATLIG